MSDDTNLRRQIAGLRHDAGAALLNGNDEAYARLSADADGLVLELALLQQPKLPQVPSVEPVAEAPRVEPDPRAAEINAAFNARFGDLDDRAFSDAAALARARLNDPAFAHVSAADFAQDIGDAVRRMHGRFVEPEQRSASSQAARTETPSVDVDELRRKSARQYIESRLARQYG